MGFKRYFMSSKYKQGQDKIQPLLFPPSIDDYVDEDNSVRVIESYVDILDLKELGFEDTRKSRRDDGQKAYSPSLLLKIYIYGYLNKIRSSRMLERECKRNIELIWLTSNLTPSYHTIADFRKNNPKALKQVFKEFVILCKNINLIDGKLTAVDGAFLRANASKNQLIMKTTLTKELKKISDEINDYFKILDYTDQEKQPLNLLSKLPKDLRKLKHQRQDISENLKLLELMDKTQYNKTDSDANLMIKPSHNLMAYNSQIVVDSSFKFIVATDIMTNVSDMKNIYTMAKQTKEILQVKNLDIVADTGYASHKEIKKCVDDNINPFIPLANIQQVQKAKGFYSQDDFKYDKDNNVYICPNNQYLIKKDSHRIQRDKVEILYGLSSSICKICSLSNKCLSPSVSSKKIYRWEHEDVIEKHKIKMKTEEAKEIVKRRGSIVEHPFGTIKRTLGWDHFLVRGKEKVSGENALIMFTYNFKRMLNLIGINLFKKLIIAIKKDDLTQIIKDIEEYILIFSVYLAYFIQMTFMMQFYQVKIKRFVK